MEDVKIKMTVKLCLDVPTSVFSKVFQSKFYKIKLLVKTCVKVDETLVFKRAEKLSMVKCNELMLNYANYAN